MQSESAPPDRDDRLGSESALTSVLAQLNRALATCIEEIEALQQRVDALEARGRSG